MSRLPQEQTPIGLVPAKQPSVSFRKRIGLDNFLLLLLASLGLAYVWPEAGDRNSPLPLEEISTYGVACIFFFYGLRLSPTKMKEGLSDWRLHLVVQFSTFLLFPALVWAVFFMTGGLGLEPLLWLGIFYVATLPSTVSSSVVMVSIAGGNLPGAIFNASISSLLGVFLTPVLLGIFSSASSTSGAGIDLNSVILKLLLQVVAPVTLGVLLHSRLGRLAEAHKAKLRIFDQAIILLIVFSSFCESFSQNLFTDYSATTLFLLGLSMLGLFLLVTWLISFFCRRLGFTRENRIVAIFCGSKKSLVHGTVMSKVLFPGAATVGIILLPLMLYHALQLMAASMMAQKMARENPPSETEMA